MGKQSKRSHNTITEFEGVEGHSGAGLSLDKDRRWEVVEQLKKDERYHVVERDVKDTRMQRVQIDHKIHEIFKLRSEGAEQEETHDEMSLDDEEKFKKEYRVTKGGPNGVMISKRRRPGKKGIKKQEDSTAKSSSSSSGSDSDPSEGYTDPNHHATGYVVVERMDKKIKHDKRRVGSGWCNCDLCNPVQPHYERSKQRREFVEEVKNSSAM
jgi:hypothetical protein